MNSKSFTAPALLFDFTDLFETVLRDNCNFSSSASLVSHEIVRFRGLIVDSTFWDGDNERNCSSVQSSVIEFREESWLGTDDWITVFVPTLDGRVASGLAAGVVLRMFWIGVVGPIVEDIDWREEA